MNDKPGPLVIVDGGDWTLEPTGNIELVGPLPLPAIAIFPPDKCEKCGYAPEQPVLHACKENA